MLEPKWEHNAPFLFTLQPHASNLFVDKIIKSLQHRQKFLWSVKW